MLTTEEDKQKALKAFERRKANPPSQINNAHSHAGSPMYFYCSFCGWLSEILPENYSIPPSKICKDCKRLKEAGLLA